MPWRQHRIYVKTSSPIYFPKRGYEENDTGLWNIVPTVPVRIPMWLPKRLRGLAGRAYFKLIDRAFNFLKSAGALKPDVSKTEYVDVEVINFDLPKLAEVIVDAIQHSMHQVECLAYRRCRCVIIGRDAMEALNIHQRLYMDFTVPRQFNEVVGKWGTVGTLTIGGVHIQVVPWFEGVLVVPLDGQ